MRSLTYTSRATALLSPDQLFRLVERARTRNARDGLSGMLVYEKGRFLQVVEGDKTTLMELYLRIMRDPRHHEIEVLEDRPITELRLPGRHMDIVPSTALPDSLRAAVFGTARPADSFRDVETEIDRIAALAKSMSWAAATG